MNPVWLDNLIWMQSIEGDWENEAGVLRMFQSCARALDIHASNSRK